MSVTLNTYAAGDTNYVAKLNSDMTQIQAALNAQEGQITAGLGAGGGAIGFNEIWRNSGMVGASSYIFSLNSDTGLSFTSGTVWHYGTQTLGQRTATTLLQFAGQASGGYYINAGTDGTLTFSTAAAVVPLFFVSFDAPSFTSVAQQQPFLFDGGDYASVLSSVTFGSFTNLASRLSAIENELGVDAQFAQVVASGLTWDYKSGRVRSDATILCAACATITLSADATHYIEVDPTTATVSYTSEGGFTNSFIPIRVISTTGGAIVSNADQRTWAIQTFSGGGGGGVLANSGTPDLIWKANRGGACTVSDFGLTVIRGSDTNVEIRWNETSDIWEWTNDGTSYAQFGNIANLNIGTGLNRRFVPVVSQPLIIDLTAVDPTSDPADAGFPVINVGSHVSTTTSAILLRGYVLDSAASTMTLTSQYGVQFAVNSADLTNNAAAMIFASPVSTFVATTLMQPISGDSETFVYRADASSDASMIIKVALIGYWDTVQGVGTQRVSAAAQSGATTNLSGNISTTDFELSFADFSAVLNRGLVTYMTVSSTIGAGSLYDIEIYNSNLADPDLLFQAINIDASAVYTTRVPWGYEDAASNLKVYLRISNNGLSAGLFTFEMRGERYA
jgi:hypothetical protein